MLTQEQKNNMKKDLCEQIIEGETGLETVQGEQ
jgi:hypothetical protein